MKINQVIVLQVKQIRVQEPPYYILMNREEGSVPKTKMEKESLM